MKNTENQALTKDKAGVQEMQSHAGPDIVGSSQTTMLVIRKFRDDLSVYTPGCLLSKFLGTLQGMKPEVRRLALKLAIEGAAGLDLAYVEGLKWADSRSKRVLADTQQG